MKEFLKHVAAVGLATMLAILIILTMSGAWR